MLIRDIMTKTVLTVTPETTLREVGRMMKEARISGVPVLNAADEIIGIVTLTDFEQILERLTEWEDSQDKDMLRIFDGAETSDQRWKGNLLVKELMTREVVVVGEDQPVAEVRRIMFKRKIHTFPVVRDKKLVGVVGKRDLIYSCF